MIVNRKWKECYFIPFLWIWENERQTLFEPPSNEFSHFSGIDEWKDRALTESMIPCLWVNSHRSSSVTRQTPKEKNENGKFARALKLANGTWEIRCRAWESYFRMDYMKQYFFMASCARVESITFRKIIYFFLHEKLRSNYHCNYHWSILDEIIFPIILREIYGLLQLDSSQSVWCMRNSILLITELVFTR